MPSPPRWPPPGPRRCRRPRSASPPASPAAPAPTARPGRSPSPATSSINTDSPRPSPSSATSSPTTPSITPPAAALAPAGCAPTAPSSAPPPRASTPRATRPPSPPRAPSTAIAAPPAAGPSCAAAACLAAGATPAPAAPPATTTASASPTSAPGARRPDRSSPPRRHEDAKDAEREGGKCVVGVRAPCHPERSEESRYLSCGQTRSLAALGMTSPPSPWRPWRPLAPWQFTLSFVSGTGRTYDPGRRARRTAMVTVRVESGNLSAAQADAVVVNLFEGVTAPGGGTGALDEALGGQIGALIDDGVVTGKRGELTTIYTFGRISAKRVLVA